MLICASASTSRMNRTQRVQRMQRLRLSISVGPKSTSARTPFAVEHPPRELHPALVRAEAVGEVLQRALAALVADRAVERVIDQQELEHAGARLDDVGGRGRDDHAVADGVEHDVCSFGIFSILTMQTRQEPSMPRPGW